MKENQGLYRQQFEHDNCGIGAVINSKGIKSHTTVENALKIVENLEHRAGKDAEGKTGDGVGIMVQISHKFFSKECAKLGIEKPDIGDTRISVLNGYDWKAHHRETNNLIGILWDFYEGTPHIMAIFFGNNLTENDWGRIVQPKEGGGRTTSVSIMSREGVNKMYQNWIAVKNDHRYIDFLNIYNKASLI